MKNEMKQLDNEELFEFGGGAFVGLGLGYMLGTVCGAIGSLPLVVYGCVTDATAQETAEACLAVVVTTSSVFSAIGLATPF